MSRDRESREARVSRMVDKIEARSIDAASDNRTGRPATDDLMAFAIAMIGILAVEVAALVDVETRLANVVHEDRS